MCKELIIVLWVGGFGIFLFFKIILEIDEMILSIPVYTFNSQMTQAMLSVA